MQEGKREEYQEIISIEEYLHKRRKIKEETKTLQKKGKSPVFLSAELFV